MAGLGKISIGCALVVEELQMTREGMDAWSCRYRCFASNMRKSYESGTLLLLVASLNATNLGINLSPPNLY